MRKAKVWDARQLPAYLTVAQYGELMGICPKTVRRMCQRGELPAHKEGPRLWRINKNAALEQRQETMEICQRNARKAPKSKPPAQPVVLTISQCVFGPVRHKALIFSRLPGLYCFLMQQGNTEDRSQANEHLGRIRQRTV